MALFELLQQHRESLSQVTLTDLFQKNPQRAEQLSFTAAGITLDISKNHLNDQSLALLSQWAEDADLISKIDDFFSGEKINTTEGRAVIHPLLRSSDSQNPIAVESRNTLKQMVAFGEGLQKGEIVSASSELFTDVVNIGIGGSDLGPRMVVEALDHYRTSPLRPHFVTNVDPQDFSTKVAELNPKTTLFIITSKSFGTQETLENMALAKQWLLDAGITHWQQQLIAVTAKPSAAQKLGFEKDKTFPFDEGVGGRYSVWSSVGLILLLCLGEENFYAFLKGASTMDKHFQSTPIQQNLPVLLALVYAWYRNFWHCQSHVVLPYANGLSQLPRYLQQLEMESLGKSVNLHNQQVATETGGVIWGAAGTIGQHSFYQLLHQGTSLIPADFIAVLEPMVSSQARGHRLLLANCIAQSRILMTGKTAEQIKLELVGQGLEEDELSQRAAHGAIPGNRPSTMITLESLTPETLGALIALYEHKVFVLAQLWRINAFDQWGVEYGKIVGNQVLDALTNTPNDVDWDASSLQLINRYKQKL